MLFNSSTYLVFLAIAIGLHWRLSASWRPLFLLLASYAFYASWNAPYLLLIVGLTGANYLLGLTQARHREQRAATLVVAITLNLGALIVFKYLGLLDESARALAAALDLPMTPPVIELLLPIGLSFFTFEFIHYQVDLYRGDSPMRDPVHFALFPAFFPTQIAGPIKRYQDFGRQLRTRPEFDPIRALDGVELIALGLFKKVVLADTLVPIADVVFAQPSQAGAADSWAGLVAFSLQIYLDFSGYTDIGRGSAQLLGFTVPENFRAPYLATSLREFWRRWHISLSLWLRDYLYIPLGGSHRGTARTYLNLFLTMSLGGLWHGAAWHFLAWGFGHGAALAAERRLSGAMPLRALVPRRVRVAMAWATTQVLVVLLWSLFRAPDVGVAIELWRQALSGPLYAGIAPLAPVALIVGGVLAVELAPRHWRLPGWFSSQPGSSVARPLYVVALGAASAVAVTLHGATRQFIYFQF